MVSYDEENRREEKRRGEGCFTVKIVVVVVVKSACSTPLDLCAT
jgi:hypothetical protein